MKKINELKEDVCYRIKTKDEIVIAYGSGKGARVGYHVFINTADEIKEKYQKPQDTSMWRTDVLWDIRYATVLEQAYLDHCIKMNRHVEWEEYIKSHPQEPVYEIY